MERILLLCVSLVFGLQIHAQDTLKISREKAEAIFLHNNLLLMSEKLNIEKQKAEAIQARLWPNPSFSISEINLWKNQTTESSPPFFGNFGKDQQISFEINQLIYTAGKRQKLIALEEVDVSKAEQYFNDLLRGLKLELRTQLIDYQYVKYSIETHEYLSKNISILTDAYKKQLDLNIISKATFMRLKAQELKINKDILSLNNQLDEIQNRLKTLLHINPVTPLEITLDGFIKNTQAYKSILVDKMIEVAKENRPDYKLKLLENEYADKLLTYEKAQRIPDLTLGINYDRNGNTMLDFVGVGLEFDLPIFNRNKGNIQKAKINIEVAKTEQKRVLISIENEILLSYKLLLKAIDFYDNIDKDYNQDLDLMLESYTKNLAKKNLSMLEYFDFLESYIENKTILLEAKRDINHKIEELNFYLGKDIYN